jgi:hypothetical protein
MSGVLVGLFIGLVIGGTCGIIGVLRDAKKTRDAANGMARLWVCPECAFGFDVCHSEADKPGIVYACPSCFEDRVIPIAKRLLRTPNRELKPWIVKRALRDMLKEKEYPQEVSA